MLKKEVNEDWGWGSGGDEGDSSEDDDDDDDDEKKLMKLGLWGSL